MKLWYEEPSTSLEGSRLDHWNRALPVGGGRLGAMVYGDWPIERIQVNEESIWAGPPMPEVMPGAKISLCGNACHVKYGVLDAMINTTAGAAFPIRLTDKLEVSEISFANH